LAFNERSGAGAVGFCPTHDLTPSAAPTAGGVVVKEAWMTPSFRSSGTIVQIVQQKDARYEIVVAQVNIVRSPPPTRATWMW
jgi:hypothetical protein